ncbi:Protein of unknown functionlike protein [Paramyrothecium foliicola]|nr:Protein of unknown functionlike protein [Paramyrothecium foliicola]
MARIQIPLDAITSRLNLSERFGSLRSNSMSGGFSNLRPISEFLDFKRLSKPANFTEMQSRVNYNLSHYSSNYAVVFAMLSIYALLSNWLLLFDIILVVAGMYLIGRLDGRDLEIGTFKATSSQLYTGLLVIAIPLGLIASPFSTLLWLIGASGVTILGGLGGRPRAPEFAPPWGRPSRRSRRRGDGGAAQHGYWGGDPRIEEVASEGDEDTDTQGVGLVSGRNSRFVSDPLRFTGTDLGDRSNDVVLRRPYDSDGEEEDSDEGSSNSDEENGYDEEELARLSPRQKEEFMVQSAMQRIRRAQEMGRTDVRLNKEELAALERRRKRLEEEAEKKKRKKKKDNRVSVPLAQLDPGVGSSSRKSSKSSQQRQESLPRHDSASSLPDDANQQVYPPMGYFPPPSGGRSRPRSSTSASQRPPSRMSGVDPFEYEYGQRPASSAGRHVSDGVARPRSSRGYYGEDVAPPVPGRQLDPFMFQTAGPRASYPSGAAAASRRHVSGSTEPAPLSRRGTPTPAPARSHRGSRRPSPDEETSEEHSESSEESTSDDLGNGAQIRPHTRGRPAAIVVEESPEPQPEPPKKKSSGSSPVKRKPVSSGKKKKR